MATVQLTSDAREDLRDLDGSNRKRVLKALKKLETEPEKRGEPLGSRALGNLTMFRKLVVGDREIRVIYRVEPDGNVVVVWVIAERADDACYELAVSRLRLHSDQELAAKVEHLLNEAWDKPTPRQ
ncbi:MAG: type II toxin-antitoxin system RelE/ParE family toxin [Actinophytocola sp.]|uniref:type II toxin-antitoxin system RelE family toxin n=1 Tax=Actinophytocola sp. TaxID=1872138 RepID=UPI003C77B109